MRQPKQLTPNTFKRALAAGERQIGLWLNLQSPTATEIVAAVGYHWLLLDMEHVCVEASDVIDHLRAAKGGTAEVVVRLPINEPVLIKRLLDAGVRSFMFPVVNSAEEARRAVAATRYPPHGVRGVGGGRATAYGQIPSYLERYHEEQCVIVQIETPAAVAAIAEIAAVDGVDGLFIGPNDLAAGMGFLLQVRAPEVQQAIAEALCAIRAAGKAGGILNFNPVEARALLQSGCQFIAVGSDASILVSRSESLLDQILAD
jgi:4-hydroxy-2-oxoheptanedioate aldolase